MFFIRAVLFGTLNLLIPFCDVFMFFSARQFQRKYLGKEADCVLAAAFSLNHELHGGPKQKCYFCWEHVGIFC